MKGALVCYTHAVNALHRAGVKLKGDVILAACRRRNRENAVGRVPGQGISWLRYGTHYLVNHGVLPDMCILGEPTDMRVVLEHFGSMWVPHFVHRHLRPYGILRRPGRNELYRRMHELMETIMQWTTSWEKKAAHGGKKAIVNLGGIRGGHPWRASRTPKKPICFSTCASRRRFP